MGTYICKECGGTVSNTLNVCPHCGYQIENITKKDDMSFAYRNDEDETSNLSKHVNVQTIVRKENHKLNISKLLIIAIVCIGIIIIFVIGVYFTRAVSVEGSFTSMYGGSPVRVVEFIPADSEKTFGTYTEKLLDYGVAVDELTISGTYAVSNGEVIMTWDLLGTDTTYVREGKYLVPSEFDFSGEVPNGKTFNANCTSEDDSYQFNEDGTFIREWAYDGDHGVEQGSYSRKGNIITISYDDETFSRQLYIHDGKINNSTYKKD